MAQITKPLTVYVAKQVQIVVSVNCSMHLVL